MFDFQCSKTFLQLLCSRESGCIMFFLCPPKFLYDIYDLFMIHSLIFYDSEIKLLDIDITNVNMGRGHHPPPMCDQGGGDLSTSDHPLMSLWPSPVSHSAQTAQAQSASQSQPGAM